MEGLFSPGIATAPTTTGRAARTTFSDRRTVLRKIRSSGVSPFREKTMRDERAFRQLFVESANRILDADLDFSWVVPIHFRQ
jgi:hypothetical protein